MSSDASPDAGDGSAATKQSGTASVVNGELVSYSQIDFDIKVSDDTGNN
jgi:hypothetical protein